ncbi:MAG: copper resistance protein CopB, partial [Nitrospira sp. WS110]|nr:copper resistance protein CopB [Nitrospira sp. WS110]
ILQGRFQTNLAIQQVEEFTTGSGLNNLEFGARLRYEIRREFAPYIGLSLDRSFGETATLVRQQGGDPSQIRLVVGLRAWF